MKAYLDFNIIVAIKKNEISLEKIRKIDYNILDFPYSASHIQEIDNISHPDKKIREEYIDQHLKVLSETSKNFYFSQKLNNEVFLNYQDPVEILNTIRENSFAKTAMQNFVNIASPEQKEATRKQLGIKSGDLNSLSSSPKEAIKQIDSILKTSNLNSTFIDSIENGIKLNPSGHTFGLSERFAGAYEMLDLLGFWKDKQTKTSNYARLWDSNHAFFAAHCNYFISDDLRNRNKAKIVYCLYNIGTKVVNSDGHD